MRNDRLKYVIVNFAHFYYFVLRHLKGTNRLSRLYQSHRLMTSMTMLQYNCLETKRIIKPYFLKKKTNKNVIDYKNVDNRTFF